TLDLDEVLALVVDRLVRVYPGASGAIFLRDQDETRERARSGQLGRSAVQAAQRAIAERRPIVAFDHIAIPLVANDRLLGAGVPTDRPELNLRRARFDLRATVAAALKEVAPMARRHKLQGPRSGQPVFVRGDRRRTAEVVAGLVHNATKYAPEGTRITVRIE